MAILTSQSHGKEKFPWPGLIISGGYNLEKKKNSIVQGSSYLIWKGIDWNGWQFERERAGPTNLSPYISTWQKQSESLIEQWKRKSVRLIYVLVLNWTLAYCKAHPKYTK